MIEQEVQRTWGTEFLNAKNLVSPVLHSTLQGERWYAHFPLALEHVSAELRREWNQFRTQRVHEWVSRWCTKMGFPDDLAFEPFPTVEKVAGAVAPNESQQGLRSLLLKAIATLSTDELLNIPITARSLVEVLRPELLAKPQGRDQR